VAVVWAGLAWADDMPATHYSTEPASATGTVRAFDDGRLNFHVTTADGLRIDYDVFALFALPGQQMAVDASTRVTPRSADNIPFRTGSSGHVAWQAPEAPGLYPITLSTGNGAVMRLNLFVMRPASDMQNQHIDDYLIGTYPAEPFRGLEAYEAPEGFVEVTPELKNVRISPHFTIGQFLCKQPSSGNKFVRVRERLVVKLERVLAALNNAGVHTDSFVVMSGYRTPSYNHAIGNVEHSRHVYGGAADIYIDVAPRDGIMDDLNHDGRLNEADAAWLYSFINDLSSQPGWQEFEGGIGQYGSTAAHGPFVHVDERGYPARWGG
jgi:hypothetical protein